LSPCSVIVSHNPCIDKRLGLCSIGYAIGTVNLIVISFGVERWVDIAEVNTSVSDMGSQDVEVITKVESIQV